jgi:putative Flp pilus-assembly TadE/G-like protein
MRSDAMRINRFRGRSSHRAESGQVLVFVLLALGLFLLGAMAFAVDLSYLWFHRQAIQTAADAACTAGAMDLLVDATTGSASQGGFSVGGGAGLLDCNSTTPNAANGDPAPCVYAALNGFPSSVSKGSTAVGDNVSVTFPPTGAVPGSPIFPTAGTQGTLAPTLVMQVTISDTIPTFFAGMLKGLTKQNIGAKALCGVVSTPTPLSTVALNPSLTSFTSTGGIKVVGGPLKSLQVNSTSGAAASIGGGSINLCAGGNNYCGSNMGVWGAQAIPGSFLSSAAACTGSRPPNAPNCTAAQASPQWLSPNAPIADPLATLVAPLPPTNVPGAPIVVASGASGCPDTNCYEYAPGYYPTGICVGIGCPNGASATAIFDPGIYYVTGGITTTPDPTGVHPPCFRPSSAPGDGSGGTVFYFPDNTGSLSVTSPGCGASVGAFTTPALNCGTALPSNLTGTSFPGSVLLAPCQAPTTPGLCAPNCGLKFNGILFFQNRATASPMLPTWNAGNSWLLGGTLYFHQCVVGVTDTSLGCASGAFSDLLTVSTTGNSFIVGAIIADQMNLSGSITMDLSPTATYPNLKATLLQ